MRIGVVAVHGVAPLPRYSFQDQFSDGLFNALGGAAAGWSCRPDYPPLGPNVAVDPEQVRLTTDTLTNAITGKVIDVHEVYWSPIDKNKTTPQAVALWLLDAAFTPLNNNARFPGQPWKALYDIAYALAAMLIAVTLVGAFLWCAWDSYRQISLITVAATAKPGQPLATLAPSFTDALTNPLRLLSFLNRAEIIALVAVLVGAVCIARAVSAILGGALVRRRNRRRNVTWALAARTTGRIALVVLAGAALIALGVFVPIAPAFKLGWIAVEFVCAALALQGASALGNNLFVNRLGDVQIYTTSDENTDYFGFRQQIRTLAEQILFAVIDRRAGPQTGADSPAYYDKIVVVGYSLGSTIAMDAIIRLHEIHEAPDSPIGPGDWGRMRAFVTLGCCLEKTKYFFDVRDPSPSIRRNQWNQKIDGHLFTPDQAVLHSTNNRNAAMPGPLGIFWLNLWYFTDLIANEMLTFRSDEAPRINQKNPAGEINVCLNQRLPRNFITDPFPHGSYLTDENFWHGPRLAPTIGAVDVLNALL